MNTFCDHKMQVTQCSLAFAMVFVCALIASGQSGRRSSGGSTSASPSVSGSKTVEKKPEKALSLHLLAGIEDADPSMNIPYYLSDTLLENCLRRLSDATDVFVTSAGRGMTRSDANRKAKEEKDRFVVWLQIGSGLASSRKPSKNGPDELYVSYTVFEPATAKVKRSGQAQHAIYKTGRGGVSTSSKNGPVYSEYSIKQAARETAERILDVFDIKSRDEH